ncbi:MAG: phosphate ABC transporter permease PstA [Conexivisphaerales archaeon]
MIAQIGRISVKRRLIDRTMQAVIILSAIAAITPLVLIIGEAAVQGLPVLSFSFLMNQPVPVGYQGGGIGPMIQGTLVMVWLATLISFPLGLCAGIFFSEWPNSRLALLSSFSNDVLAEFPSMVIGIFVYIIVVLATGTFSALAGGVALGIIMVPLIARTTEEGLKSVPPSVREASIALGIPRWKTVFYVVIRSARGMLVTGAILAVARAAGETAPLILTAGFSNAYVSGLLKPAGSIPYLIYYYGISPYQSWHAIAWGASLVLVMIIMTISLTLRLLVREKSRGVGVET